MFAPGYRGPMNADAFGPVGMQPMPMMQPYGMQPPPMNYVQTGIQPRQVYTPQLSRQAINQGRAGLAQQFNPMALAKQFDRPGVSRGPQTAARIAPMMAQGYAARSALGPNIRFSDDAANRQMLLSGQSARDQSAGQWADLMSRGQDQWWQSQFGNFGMLMNLLGNFMG